MGGAAFRPRRNFIALSPINLCMAGIEENGTLMIRQRRLPHWELSGSLYYITFCTSEHRVLSTEGRDGVMRIFQEQDGEIFQLMQLSIMPDHLHMLCTLQTDNQESSLVRLMNRLKGASARIVNRIEHRLGSAVWQDEYWDRIIRDQEEYNMIYQYIAFNAVEAGLANEPLEYPWYYSRRVKAHRARWVKANFAA